jgi:hypothetical protein
MSDETFAAPTSSEPGLGTPSEADYDAICAAVMETVRGRWFLTEYSRRNRHADTELVLGAINRIETTLRGDRTPQSIGRFRDDLMEMARTIARTKSEVAAIRPQGESNGSLNGVTEDLDFIVQATEQATSSILAAAEQIQETAWAMREQGNDSRLVDELDARAVDIYAAVSLQDVAGQRTKKVVHAMRDLEGRINDMIEAWGAEPMNGAELADSLHRRLALPASTLSSDNGEPAARTEGAGDHDGAASGLNGAALSAPLALNEEPPKQPIEERAEAARTDDAVETAPVVPEQVVPETAEATAEPAPTEPAQAAPVAAAAAIDQVATTEGGPAEPDAAAAEAAEAPPEPAEPALEPVNGTHHGAAQTDIIVADAPTDAVAADAVVSDVVASDGIESNGVTTDVVAADVAADDPADDAAAVASAVEEQAEIASAAASDEPLPQATIVAASDGEVSEDSEDSEEIEGSGESEAAEISSSYSDVLPLIFPPSHEIEPEPAQTDTAVVVLSEPGFRSDRTELLVVTPQNAWTDATVVDSMTTGTLDSVLVISDLMDDTAADGDLYARHIERSNRPTARGPQPQPTTTEIPPEIVFDFGPLLPRASSDETTAAADVDSAPALAIQDVSNSPQPIQARAQAKAEAPSSPGASAPGPKANRVSVDQNKASGMAAAARKIGDNIGVEATRPGMVPISPATPAPAANVPPPPPPPPLLPQRTAATAPPAPPMTETRRTPVEPHLADVVVLARPDAKPRVEPPPFAPVAATATASVRVEDAKSVASPPAKPVEPPAAKAATLAGNIKVLRPAQPAQPVDPLAAIAALSDEEKIALFS